MYQFEKDCERIGLILADVTSDQVELGNESNLDEDSDGEIDHLCEFERSTYTEESASEDEREGLENQDKKLNGRKNALLKILEPETVTLFWDYLNQL